jgi:hypothetical protein
VDIETRFGSLTIAVKSQDCFQLLTLTTIQRTDGIVPHLRTSISVHERAASSYTDKWLNLRDCQNMSDGKAQKTQ